VWGESLRKSTTHKRGTKKAEIGMRLRTMRERKRNHTSPFKGNACTQQKRYSGTNASNFETQRRKFKKKILEGSRIVWM